MAKPKFVSTQVDAKDLILDYLHELEKDNPAAHKRFVVKHKSELDLIRDDRASDVILADTFDAVLNILGFPLER